MMGFEESGSQITAGNAVFRRCQATCASAHGMRRSAAPTGAPVGATAALAAAVASAKDEPSAVDNTQKDVVPRGSMSARVSGASLRRNSGLELSDKGLDVGSP